MNAPKRIVMVSTGLGVGGAERQLILLVRQLQSLGSRISVVSLIKPGPLKEELEEAGIPVLSLGMKRGVPGPGAIFRLAKIVRNVKPDLVHAHMFHANILARVSRLFWRKIPLVCTIQNVNEVSSRSTKWNVKTWRDDAYRLTNSLASKTTAICEAAVRRYVDIGAFRQPELVYVPNAIPVSKFARDIEAGARVREVLGLGDRIVGMMVARMEPPKDQPLLLRAWAAALAQNPNLHLVLVGDGPARAQLEKLATDLDIRANVTFTGIRKDISALMSMADFFLLITVMEGLPLAIVEAAAASLPVIASIAGGIPEAINDRVTGFLVPPGDQAKLVEAINAMVSLGPSGRMAMGKAARELVSAKYDFEVMVQSYLRVYNGAIQALGKN